MKRILGVVVTALLAGTASAQVYNQDIVSFEGILFVVDNPTSPACQAVGVNFNNAYRFTYRFVQNPVGWALNDAFIFWEQKADGPAAKRLTPNSGVSLNGTTVGTWEVFGSAGGAATYGPSTSTLTIQSGLNQPVQIGVTGHIKILGSFGDFLYEGCNANIHGAAVVRPN